MKTKVFIIQIVCLLHLWHQAAPVFSYSSLDNNNDGCKSDAGWTRYKDEKCIKLFPALVPFDQAEKQCTDDYTVVDGNVYETHYRYKSKARLLTVASAEEQEFIVDLLFEKGDLSDSVWLGAQWNPNVSRNASEQWEWHRAGGLTDKLTYSNWRAGYPKGLPKDNVTTLAGSEEGGALPVLGSSANANNKTCLEMVGGGVEEATGQWINEPCSKNNRVVCERRQVWGEEKIQELLMKVARQLNDSRQEQEVLQQKVDDLIKHKNQTEDETILLKQKQEKLASDQVPLGFVYIQLPEQLEPAKVFSSSSAVWKDISQSFKGVFFRVAGSGGAGRFGDVQEQAVPAIDRISRNWCFVGPNGACTYRDAYGGVSADAKSEISLLGNGSWSGPVWTVNKYLSNSTEEKEKLPYFGEYLTFHNSGGEVRPRNMAVRVWKRIA